MRFLINCLLALHVCGCGLAAFGQDQKNALEWRQNANDRDQIDLYTGSTHVGSYRQSLAKYWTISDAGWSAKPLPIALPAWTRDCDCGESCKCPGANGENCTCVRGRNAIKNFGVDTGRIHVSSANTLNGKPCSQKELTARLKAAPDVPVPADGVLMRFTLIGTEADCAKILADLKGPAFDKIRDKIAVHEYRPDEWPILPGFVKDGKPVIYCQSAKGAVVMRGVEYKGAEALAVSLPEAIRRANTDYDPAKDPDMDAKPKDPKQPSVESSHMQTHCMCYAALALFSGGVWIGRKKKTTPPRA